MKAERGLKFDGMEHIRQVSTYVASICSSLCLEYPCVTFDICRWMWIQIWICLSDMHWHQIWISETEQQRLLITADVSTKITSSEIRSGGKTARYHDSILGSNSMLSVIPENIYRKSLRHQ